MNRAHLSMRTGRFLRIAVFVGISFSLASCGQGVDPLTALNAIDPATLGQDMLAFPLSSSLAGGVFTIAYGSGNEWILGGATFTNTQAKAPAAGIVILADSTSQTVTIMHNSRLSTRIRGVTPTVNLVGSYVAQGQQIGVIATAYATAVPFAVILDNEVVCPMSFLTPQARAEIQSGVNVAQLCPT